MEEQIKEEAKDASLCFETASQDGSASLSFVEQYARYLRGNSPESDSDCDFLPDETMLRDEYLQLTRGNTSFKNHHLSTGPPGKYRSAHRTNRTLSEETIDVVANNNTSNNGQVEGTTGPQGDLKRYDELTKKLAEVRRTGPEGNSIFCKEEELDAIQERYGAILDFLKEKTKTFEKKSNSKDSENEEQVDVGQVAPRDQRESMRLVQEKSLSIQRLSDRLNELKNQVKEKIELLEIYERTKMENNNKSD